MTTLIFVTADDASPLIVLQASEDEVIETLSAGAGRGPSTPGAVAVGFLRQLPRFVAEDWRPSLESSPIDCEGSALDWAEEPSDDAFIVWNVARWEESTPASPPPIVGYDEIG